MQIKLDGERSNKRSWVKFRDGGRAQWAGVFLACLLLFSVSWLLFAPLAGWSAAPVLGVGPFTNIAGVNYVNVTVISNATSTNVYQIDHRGLLDTNVPWVGATIGITGQTNFLIQLGPEETMFFRAVACDDCDGDGIKNWQDANPGSTNVGLLTITIENPTNGANIY